LIYRIKIDEIALVDSSTIKKVINDALVVYVDKWEEEKGA